MYYNNITRHPTKNGVKNISRLSTIGKLFFVILFIVVFEGAFRKWISSSLTTLLVLLRDVIALYGIFWSIKTKRLRFTQRGAQILWLWTAIFMVWGLLQIIVNSSSFLIFIIGARFWLLYLWFAYAAAVSFCEHDFNFIAKTLLLLLLIMTPLAIMQHFLPPSSFLNKQLDNEVEDVFLVSAGIVRTTGTFSFTLGFTTFLAVVSPFVLALLAPGTRLWKKKWTPKVCLLALGIATIVSGSRGAIIYLFTLFAAYAFLSLIYSKRSKKGSTVVVIVTITALLALVPYVFSRAADATQDRFESAAQSENIYSRIAIIFFGEPDTYNNFKIIGHGVGVGTNFAGTVATGERTFLLAETETTRAVLEGGLLGLAFIGLKFLVMVMGLLRSCLILKSSANILPLLLWITTSLALFSWSIIGQLTVNALGFLLFGLAFASLRLFAKKL